MWAKNLKTKNKRKTVTIFFLISLSFTLLLNTLSNGSIPLSFYFSSCCFYLFVSPLRYRKFYSERNVQLSISQYFYAITLCLMINQSLCNKRIKVNYGVFSKKV